MKALFVDTAGWMACADAADPAHEAACRARDAALEQGCLLVTTDYVADETLTLIRTRLGLPAAEAWWRQVEGSSRVRWERIDEVRAEKARHSFFRHRDKEYSFTDCTSLVVMAELRLKQALTTDRPPLRSGLRMREVRSSLHPCSRTWPRPGRRHSGCSRGSRARAWGTPG
jgi:predicted nucleic acid-binding protein